ncbi:MAG: methyltransferase domain-containing protein [Candidatus Hydrogenedentes bacterium]|nr:methyltransferase domain-containing protein [Candidatus Hydrogenedentota bacterium]
MSPNDPFAQLARYYDPIMDHVNYDRWLIVATGLCELLPAPFRHADVGCGTGTLLRMLQRGGWQSVGLDFSPAMLRAARKRSEEIPLVCADMRALPLAGSVGFITCLFDSLNFLLDDGGIDETFRSFYDALTPEGLLYFDIVTERMVTEHFNNQGWIEDNGRFTTRWASTYNQSTSITETSIRVNTQQPALIRERIYAPEQIEQAAERAGFHILSVLDAERWRKPTPRSTRLDFIVWKGDLSGQRNKVKRVIRDLRPLLEM